MSLRNVDTEADGRLRLMELRADYSDETSEERTKNRDFTQVYPKGWRRLRVLINENPSAARIFAFLAENMDGTAGAVVVSQDVLAKELGVHVRTIKRLTGWLEKQGAIVRIRVGTGVYAYCLDPSEIWKSWDDQKEYAAFVTKTLVLKKDRENGEVRRKLKFMMGQPELPGVL